MQIVEAKQSDEMFSDEFNTLFECLPLLYGEVTVVLAVRRLGNKLETCRHALYGDRLAQIWPEKWTCECLPAPLEVLVSTPRAMIVYTNYFLLSTPMRMVNWRRRVMTTGCRTTSNSVRYYFHFISTDTFFTDEQMQRPRPVAEMRNAFV